MRWIRSLERRLGPLALPHLTLCLVAGQVIFYIAQSFDATIVDALCLRGDAVLRGEVWRLVTFLFIPPATNPLFALFGWYFFYLMGSALESQWGAFRYNAFLLIAWAATVAVGFILPHTPATNLFIGGSVFLAFAWLYPEFQIFLFFILPVKVKWIALVTWLSYAMTLLAGTAVERLLVLASVLNLLVFFGRDIYYRIRAGRRRMAQQVAVIREQAGPRHRCAVCGKDSESQPDLDFRYCTDCRPARAYCPDHLNAHPHLRDDGAPKAAAPEPDRRAEDYRRAER